MFFLGESSGANGSLAIAPVCRAEVSAACGATATERQMRSIGQGLGVVDSLLAGELLCFEQSFFE